LAFVHKALLSTYWAPVMAPLREFVDGNMNCEDILMNFIAVNATQKPPVLVRGKGLSMNHWKKKGISSKPGHKVARNRCMDQFFETFGPNGLLFNDQTAVQALHPIAVDEYSTFKGVVEQ